MQETTSALDEIRIIRRMMGEARRSTEGLRIPLLTFGLLGVATSLASHALLSSGRSDLIGLAWLAFAVIGTATSLALLRRRSGRTRVVSFVDQTIGMLWIGVGVSVGIATTGFFAVGADGAVFPLAVIASIIALGLWVSAKLMDWSPLYAAAALWWAAAVLMLIRPAEAFLIEAGALAAGYLLPAYLLHGRSDGNGH